MSDFGIDQLTLGEIAQIEDITGLSLSVMSDESAPKAKLLIAMASVTMRRKDPTFTLSQAEAMSMEDFSELMSGVDPKEKESSESEPTISHSS